MKIQFLLYLLGASCLLASEPQFKAAIDYADPSKYLSWPDSLGDRTAILTQAAPLKGDSDLKTIRNVLKWMESHLKYDSLSKGSVLAL